MDSSAQYETRGAATAYSPYAGASFAGAAPQAVAKLGGRHKNKSTRQVYVMSRKLKACCWIC